jgi:hypothetical protein
VTEGCAVPFCSLFAAGRAGSVDTVVVVVLLVPGQGDESGDTGHRTCVPLQRSGQQQQQTRTCVPLRALQTTTAAAGDKRTKKGTVLRLHMPASPALRPVATSPLLQPTPLQFSLFSFIHFSFTANGIQLPAASTNNILLLYAVVVGSG